MTHTCGLCGRHLGVDSDSPGFCSEEHQRIWHAQPGLRDVAAIVNAFGRALTAAFAQLAAAMQPLVTALEQAGRQPKPLPAGVKARALELRRTRNTGPTRLQHAPRRIDPRRTR